MIVYVYSYTESKTEVNQQNYKIIIKWQFYASRASIAWNSCKISQEPILMNFFHDVYIHVHVLMSLYSKLEANYILIILFSRYWIAHVYYLPLRRRLWGRLRPPGPATAPPSSEGSHPCHAGPDGRSDGERGLEWWRQEQRDEPLPTIIQTINTTE